MQLFTVGLTMLNDDGTRMDGAGEVYSNEDVSSQACITPTRMLRSNFGSVQIMEYSRVWTGFQRQDRRGNIETGNSANRVDPMKIRADWRDRFPKMVSLYCG